jgi:hypothetical protein
MDELEWMQQMPESMKDAPYFKAPEDGTVRTVEQIKADLTNAAQLQGNLKESHIKIPAQDSADEDKEAWRERILSLDSNLVRKPDDHSPVPDSLEGYTQPELEGVELDEEQGAKVKELALKSKWTQAQYEGFVHQMAADIKAGKEGQTQWQTERDAKLAEQLGQAKDGHLQRTEAALRDINPDLKLDGLDASTVLALDTLVHQIIEMGGESAQFVEQEGAGKRVLTPGEAHTRCTEIRKQMLEERPNSREYKRLNQELVHYQGLARAAS